ncbi:MAG: 4-hydroxy-tetrahydrodipicolinate reductase, partial [Bartonella sp.]|nr:4-hydroxy-tetrahydrodipicolinate reductase [Bartonella sp.]
MRLAIVGANGKMGRELITALQYRQDVKLNAAIVRKGSPFVGKDASILIGSNSLNIRITDDFEEAFSKAECILDFSQPQASIIYADYAAQKGLIHII